MSTATHSHYENANFLRELAENLPRILPGKDAAKAELLQRRANEELAQAEYADRVRAKVAAARADKRPGMSTDQLRQALQVRQAVNVLAVVGQRQESYQVRLKNTPHSP